MNKYILIVTVLLVGCNDCPVDIGDSVVENTSGMSGEVIAIEGWGASTRNCSIVVLHEDRSQSEGYTQNWNYKKRK